MSGFRANREILTIFAAKLVRTFSYGYLGILLPLYLADLGLSASGIGASVTMTLVGSALLTWAVRAPAERLGVRTALLGLAALTAIAAAMLLVTRNPYVVVLAAMLGNIAVGTGETGPFLSIEQVAIARAAPADRRTTVLSVYNLLGYGAAALGAAVVSLGTPHTLFAGFLAAAILQGAFYALLGRVTLGRSGPRAGPRSTPLIRRLAGLFALDSFAGGFVLQSLVAYFLHTRFDLDLETLGHVFFVAQLLTAASLLLAPRLARTWGLLLTMVVTHLVSNVFLIAIAFAPVAWLFSQSTNSVVWMGVLHLLFWFIATMFGLKFLDSGFSHSKARSSAGLYTWVIIFILVAVQMTTALRPIVGKSETGTFFPTTKKFFLSHWSDSLSAPARPAGQ